MFYVVEHNENDENLNVYPVLCYKNYIADTQYISPRGNRSKVLPATDAYLAKLVAIHKPRPQTYLRQNITATNHIHLFRV